jgi:hypothetical protein
MIYLLGDSHAKGIGDATGAKNNLGVDGEILKNIIRRQIPAIPEGSKVILVAGANDVRFGATPTEVVDRVQTAISLLEEKKCEVFYVLFPVGTVGDHLDAKRLAREALKSSVNIAYDLEGKGLADDGKHCSVEAYGNVPYMDFVK